VLGLEDKLVGIDDLLSDLVTTCAPEMLTLFGVGVDTAATLLVTAGDNPRAFDQKPPGPSLWRGSHPGVLGAR
jgi:hypothetical protein